MEIKFFTEDRILDLSGQKITTQDTNSKMNDKMFSKYFFPFEIYMNEEFINSFGDYESDDAFELENTFEGTLLFENKIHQAKLVLLSVEGKLLTGQIDFGFEDLPNFDKKLAELPLHKFSVPDIHTYARDIAGKKYPETDFNFPRMYTSKYPPDQEVWDAFDGYYNDLKTDGSEMRRNYIDEFGDIYNVNIIHPTPHLIYVLKAGFLDAGLILEGDILTDPILAQRWIFSGTEYFSRLTQRRVGMLIYVMDYDETYKNPLWPYPIGLYDRTVVIPKAGNYRLKGLVRLETHQSGLKKSWVEFRLNNSIIYAKNTSTSNDVYFDININVAANTEFKVTGVRSYGVGDTEEFLRADIFSTDAFQEAMEGEDNGVITNLNEVDLTRAVPDMTFGDLVNNIRNRFNYGLDVVDNVVYMNRLGDEEPTDAKDFTMFEVSPANRKKTLLQKRSFLLRSTELDEGPQTSMYYDKDGAFLNKKENAETIIIESNVIILQTGVPKTNGYDTAIIKKDTEDALQLVWYDGLNVGQNNAKNPAGAEYPELFYSHWEKWLRQRIRGYEFQWKFYCPAEEFNYKITNHIFAFNNIHNIKTWTKDLVEGTYEVDIVTETI